MRPRTAVRLDDCQTGLMNTFELTRELSFADDDSGDDCGPHCLELSKLTFGPLDMCGKMPKSQNLELNT